MRLYQTLLLLMLSCSFASCSDSPVPAARLLQDDEASPLQPLAEIEDAMVILAQKAGENSKVFYVRFNLNYHEVHDCSSVDQLAGMLQSPLPPDALRLSEERLHAEGYRRGRDLSCTGRISPKAGDVFFDQEKQRFKIGSGAGLDAYLFRIKKSQCRNPWGLAKLFGIDESKKGLIGPFEYDADQNKTVDCFQAAVEIVAYLSPDGEAPSFLGESPANGPRTYVVRFQDTAHEVKDCADASNLAKLLGIATPSGLVPRARDFITDELDLEWGAALSCTGQTSKTPNLYVDSDTGFFFVETGVPEKFYTMDFKVPGSGQANGCLKSDILKLFGYDSNSDELKRPALKKYSFPLDCGIHSRGDQLFRIRLPVYLESIGLDPPTTEEQLINIIALQHFEDGQSYLLPVGFIQNEAITDAQSADDLNSSANTLVARLSQRFLDGEYETLAELPVKFVNLSDTLIYDICLEKCDVFQARHRIMRYNTDYEVIFLDDALAAEPPLRKLQLTSLANDAGNYDFSYLAGKAVPNTKYPGVTAVFESCDRSLLEMFGFATQTSRSQSDWLTNWEAYYGGQNAQPTATPLREQRFSCGNLALPSSCIWRPDARTYAAQTFNENLSSRMRICDQSRFVIELNGDVTVRGDTDLLLNINDKIDEVIISAKQPRTLTYQHECRNPNPASCRDVTVLTGPKNLPSWNRKKALGLSNIKLIVSRQASLSTKITGIFANNLDLRLLNSEISSGKNGFETDVEIGLKLVGGSLYCLRCRIEANKTAIEAKKTDILISGGRRIKAVPFPRDESSGNSQDEVDPELDTGLHGQTRGIHLEGGSQIVMYRSFLRGNEGAWLLSDLERNTRMLAINSQFIVGKADSLVFFTGSFHEPRTNDSPLGTILIKDSKFESIPSTGKFLLLRQNSTSKGKFGSMDIDIKTEFYSSIEEGQASLISPSFSTYQAFTCDRLNAKINPISIRIGTYSDFCDLTRELEK